MPEPATGSTTPCASTAGWVRAAALGLLFLFCFILRSITDSFGLLISLLANPADSFGSLEPARARSHSGTREVLLLAPFLWVAVELARTRITGFPWDLLGIAQVDNIPLARIATVTGVYGLSFEIMVVNTALAAAFVIRSERGQRSKRDASVAGGSSRRRWFCRRGD